MPTPAATAILEFGKLIHTEASRPATERDPQHVAAAEERLIQQLSTDDNTLLKPALQFHVSRPIDPLTLRALALTSYLQLCTNYRTAVSDIAIACGDDEPAQILAARQTITQLLYAKRLLLEANIDTLALGKPMLALLTGGGNALPLTITQQELQAQWQRNEAAAAKRQVKAAGQAEGVPSAKSIYDQLSRFIIGQHDLKVALAVAGRQILLRREAKRQNRREVLPPRPAVGIIGASGSGKSYACRVLSRILNLPHASLDCSVLSPSGYIGDDLSSCLYLVAQSAAAMSVDPADGAVVHLDEIDKISSSNYESPTTLGVQFEALRLLDNAEMSYPACGMTKWGGASATMPTSNLLVVCSGAFSWLADDLEGRKPTLGFAGEALDGGPSAGLRELLMTRGGMIPELINRFTGIVKMDALTATDIAAILLSDHGPLGEYRATFQAEGRTLVVERDAALLVGRWSIQSGLMGRGPQAALEQLLRESLFTGQPKEVVITAEAVRQGLLADRRAIAAG